MSLCFVAGSCSLPERLDTTPGNTAPQASQGCLTPLIASTAPNSPLVGNHNKDPVVSTNTTNGARFSQFVVPSFLPPPSEQSNFCIPTHDPHRGWSGMMQASGVSVSPPLHEDVPYDIYQIAEQAVRVVYENRCVLARRKYLDAAPHVNLQTHRFLRYAAYGKRAKTAPSSSLKPEIHHCSQRNTCMQPLPLVALMAPCCVAALIAFSIWSVEGHGVNYCSRDVIFCYLPSPIPHIEID